MIKKIDLTKKVTDWNQLEYLIVTKAMKHPGARMVLVLATNKDNHAIAETTMVMDIARMCHNGGIPGEVTKHRLTFGNGTTLSIVGYTNYKTRCRGLKADFVFLPKDAPQEVRDVVTPMQIAVEKAWLYSF